MQRRLPIGAESSSEGTHFRVWAPCSQKAEIVFRDGSHKLDRDPAGYFQGFIAGVPPGFRYHFRLNGQGRFPDPASRFQPDGVHGPSEVIDPGTFGWTDSAWQGVSIEGQVLYELHIGTFTREGTWSSATGELQRLADLGITVLELMPVGEFTGNFGWGYDGTYWFAPTRLYGTPDDFRRFVNAAHALSIGVILDVIYNHFGPEGNYLPAFSPHFLSPKKTDWGDAVNFDGDRSESVREFTLSNVRYWIDEFHLDGFRLDATQQIFDASPEHIVAAIAKEAKRAAGPRKVIVIGENEPNNSKLVRKPAQGGHGLDALWNDDFHHASRVALTGHNEAYYSGYNGSPQELISAIKYGPLYQGQLYYWQKKGRGISSLDLPPATAVVFLENHDQIANSARGARLHTLSHPGTYRALTALLLLAPGTPLLFQGQEFGSSKPFHYFADHTAELGPRVRSGRLEFLSQFPSLLDPETHPGGADPCDRTTFENCKLDPSEIPRNRSMVALHRDLLDLRRSTTAFHSQRASGADGAVLSPSAFVIRFLTGGRGDRLLIVNLGLDLHLCSVAEPLMAPPDGFRWELIWSSENPSYGGSGTARVESAEGWSIPGHSAVVMGTAAHG